MSVSENYTPQSENLDQLTKVLNELGSITEQNTTIKNRIIDKVDELIKQVKYDGESDHLDLIKNLDYFLDQFETDGQEGIEKDGNDENGEAHKIIEEYTIDQKKELLKQNKRLKEVLANRRSYLQQIQNMDSEYESNIDLLLSKIEETKSNSDIKRLQTIKQLRETIEISEKEEFELFEELANKKEIIYKLTGILRDFYSQLN